MMQREAKLSRQKQMHNKFHKMIQHQAKLAKIKQQLSNIKQNEANI